MAQTTAYSYLDVTCTVNSRDVHGLWEGDDAVLIEEGADIGTGLIGADGSALWSQHADRSARITLNLQHTSPTHAYLTDLLARQREAGLDGIPFTLNDRRSNEGGSADRCYIIQGSSTGKGRAATVRTWVLWTGEYARTKPNG